MSEPLNVEIKKMLLLPPAPGRCQICATVHDPEDAHNAESLYYQTKFYQEHGRSATWGDAIAHLTPERRKLWIEKLREVGVEMLEVEA